MPKWLSYIGRLSVESQSCRAHVGNELNHFMHRKQGEKSEGELGESEGTPVNVLKRSIVPVYWIQVYPRIGRLWHGFCWHSSACDVDEKCDRHHLLSNHLDIEAIIDKAFELFLRDEQKFARRISIKARTFLRFFKGALGSARFSTVSTINNECNKRKSWLVNFIDHHRFASRSHDDIPSSAAQAIWNNRNRHILGAVKIVRWMDGLTLV